MKNRLKSFLKDCAGLAATEFAILGPVLSIILIMVIDVGLAVHERMELDQSLRVGADFAMNNSVDPAFLERMMVSAASGEYVETDTGNQTRDASSSPFNATATAYYFCPEEPGIEVAEDYRNCNDNVVPLMGFQLELEQTHKAIFLGDMMLKSKLSVQVQ